MPKTKSRSRNYVFTLNNWTEEHKSMLAMLCKGSDSIRCLFYGEEVGNSGTPHLQGFICYKAMKSHRQVVKQLPGAHVEPMNGTIEQSVVYCEKGGKTTLHGILPMSNTAKGKKEKERWDRIKTLAKSGKLDEIESDVYIRHYNVLKRIAADHAPAPASIDNLINEWYHGPSGTGKSRKARTDYPDAYIKLNNKWWDGYNGEDTVIIEDIDKYDVALGGHLKRWSDHYPFPAEFKGGVKKIRPKKIIITSNYHPSEIWEDRNTIEPIERRYKVTHFNTFKTK